MDNSLDHVLDKALDNASKSALDNAKDNAASSAPSEAGSSQPPTRAPSTSGSDVGEDVDFDDSVSMASGWSAGAPTVFGGTIQKAAGSQTTVGESWAAKCQTKLDMQGIQKFGRQIFQFKQHLTKLRASGGPATDISFCVRCLQAVAR